MNLRFPIDLSFFRNKEFNQFYLAIFIMIFGESLINIFVPIFLFNSGFPIHQILFFYLLEAFYFLIFSYPAAKLVSKIGVKHSILLSTPFFVAFVLGLLFINFDSVIFFLLPAFMSLRAVFYNYGYDLNFLNNSEEGKFGRQLAALGIFTLLAGAIAPFFGGLLAKIDFGLAFTVSSILVIGGTVPLFFSTDKFEKSDFSLSELTKKIFSNIERGNFISFSGYAIEASIGKIIWPIFIIIIVGSLSKTGLIVSLSLLISILAFYFIGQITDKINKITLFKIGTILYFLAWLGRIFADSSFKILFIDSYKNLSEKFLQMPWEAQTYDLAKRDNYFEFVVFRQMVFNFIRIIVLPFLVLVFWLDFYPFIVSFLTASVFSLGYMFLKS